MCVVYDFGEVIYGDIFVVEQVVYLDKGEQECVDLLQLICYFDVLLCDCLFVLWDEYECGEFVEVLVVKVLDKLEILFQYIQGDNLVDFDYVFNFDYGCCYIDCVLLFKILCELFDVRI